MQVVLEKRPLNECSVVAVVVVVMVVVVVVIVVVVVVKKIPVAPVTERSLSMSMDSWWGTKSYVFSRCQCQELLYSKMWQLRFIVLWTLLLVPLEKISSLPGVCKESD